MEHTFKSRTFVCKYNPNISRTMKYNEIGKTGMKVSSLSFGASSLGGVFHEINEEGRTIIMITHDAHIASHAKRIVRILDGNIGEGDTADA